MRRYLDFFSRFFVGSLFIFSGLIKLNDPVGMGIKMEEYFEVFSADLGSFFHAFIPWSIEIGMLIIILEVILGVALILYYRINITMWALLGLIIMFTFLTFYSAYFDKVTDCGCFGDAIKLTPWQSFYKDIVLLLFITYLFLRRKYNTSIGIPIHHHIVMVAALCTTLFLGIYAVRHLPFIDFRPYKVGAVIPDEMVSEERPVIEYLFEKEGKLVSSMKFLPAEQGYTYRSSKILNEDKITPRITDYAVTDQQGQNITQNTFLDNLFLIILYEEKTVPDRYRKALRELTQKLQGNVTCFIFTSLDSAQVTSFQHTYQVDVPYYFVDATVLKTMLRSSPGMMLWQKGKVLAKWHYRDTPTMEDLNALL